MSPKDPELTLLCDHCEEAFHTYCLDPPLTAIPEGYWYCSKCSKLDHVGKEHEEPVILLHQGEDGEIYFIDGMEIKCTPQPVSQ